MKKKLKNKTINLTTKKIDKKIDKLIKLIKEKDLMISEIKEPIKTDQYVTLKCLKLDKKIKTNDEDIFKLQVKLAKLKFADPLSFNDIENVIVGQNGYNEPNDSDINT